MSLAILLIALLLLVNCKKNKYVTLIGVLLLITSLLLYLYKNTKESDIIVEKGEFDDIYTEYFQKLMGAVRKYVPDKEWKLGGSIVLYMASPFFENESTDYKFLNTKISSCGEVVRRDRDIDIYVSTVESFEGFSKAVSETFPDLEVEVKDNLNGKSQNNWAVLTGKTTLFRNFSINLEKDQKIRAMMNSRGITEPPKFNIDMTFYPLENIEALKNPPSSLRRNFSAFFRDNRLVFSFFVNMYPVKLDELTYNDKNKITSFIQSSRTWQWKFRRSKYIPGFTSSGDHWPMNTTDFTSDKKVQNFFSKNDVKSALDWVFNGNDSLFFRIFTPDVKRGGSSCGICKVPVRKEDRVVSLECGHEFHLACWLDFVNTYYMNFYKDAKKKAGESCHGYCTCPMCNKNCAYLKGYFEENDVIIEECYQPFWNENLDHSVPLG